MTMTDNLSIAPVQRGLETKNSEHTRHWWSATIHSTRPIESRFGDKFFPDRASCNWWETDGPTIITVEGNKMKKDGTPGKMRAEQYFYFEPGDPVHGHEQLPIPTWLMDLFDARKHDPVDEDRDPVKPTYY